MNLDNFYKKAKQNEKVNLKLLNQLKKKPPKNLDYISKETHEEVFSEINCLECANCCKTTGPLFTEKDIERISKYLKIKPSTFEEKYLKIDEDGDKVLQNLPCHFLLSDNRCSIYDVRPKACKEYPHTDRKKIYQINTIMMKNTLICPAANRFVEKLMQKINNELLKNQIFNF